jgi:rSAM/selenodomain-associated transferase 2
MEHCSTGASPVSARLIVYAANVNREKIFWRWPALKLISIIIPALNEARNLPDTLAALPVAPDLEIILVDGGSRDGTWEIAGRFPWVRRLQAPPGRGRQQNAGARVARGELLAFVHADTLFGEAHLRVLRHRAADTQFAAGAFELQLIPARPALRLVAWGANLRSRWLGLPYGDQVLVVRRRLFWELGGFAPGRPEDLDLVLRLRRHTRLEILAPPVASSGRRWLEHGYFRTTAENWLALARHLLERLLSSRWKMQKSERGKT